MGLSLVVDAALTAVETPSLAHVAPDHMSMAGDRAGQAGIGAANRPTRERE